MEGLFAFFSEHQVVIIGLLLAVSEALSLIPSVKANGIFQLVFGWLQKEKPVA